MTLRPATPSGPVARKPGTCTVALVLPASPLCSSPTRSAGARFDSGGDYAGPAEKPFGDVQLPLRLIVTRYEPVGMLNAATVSVAPSPRSTTLTFPVTAEPPIARSSATWPRLFALAAAMVFCSASVPAPREAQPATCTDTSADTSAATTSRRMPGAGC